MENELSFNPDTLRIIKHDHISYNIYANGFDWGWLVTRDGINIEIVSNKEHEFSISDKDYITKVFFGEK